MEKNTEAILQEIVDLLGHESDTKLRSLLEDLLSDVKKEKSLNSVLDNSLNVESLLNTKTITHGHDLETIRRLLKQLEEKIEALLEKIVCLLKELRNKLKQDLLGRKKLLRLVLELVNLINLKHLLEKLEAILDKKN